MMNETHYCIICGEPFDTDDPKAALCSKHAGGRADKSELHKSEVFIPINQVVPQDAHSPFIANAEWTAGQVILDTYEVKGELGKGGFGRVYRVHHKAWNMDLAVKRALNLDEQGKRAFISEAQKWIDLGLHPHIISCYYVRNIDGFPHTFAELAEGGSLESWIQRGKYDLYAGDSQAVLSRILDIAIQFAWGLAYAHEQGLVHQDVKPQNALMTPDGILKVTDFGLARARGSLAPGGTSPVPGGEGLVSNAGYTLAYRSTEQAEGKKLSLATDIWSWAVSVLEMFNGGISWLDGQGAAAALESCLLHVGEDEDIPPMPKAVAELLRACFQEDPKARPKDMLEIADRLIGVYQQETGQTYFREIPKPADLRADSLNNKALTMLDLGKKQDARELWQQALAIDPHHAEATYNLGIYRWEMGQQTDLEVTQQLEAIRNIQSDHWMPHYLLGLVYKLRSAPLSARQEFEEAERLSPGNNLVQQGLDHLDDTHPVRHLRTIEGHTGTVNSLVITPDGRKIVSGSYDNTLRIWDLDSGQCQHTLAGHTGSVSHLAITPDGRTIVSGSYDKTLRIWDLESGRCLHILAGHTELVSSLAITPDGCRIISGQLSDQRVCVWDLESGNFLYYLLGHIKMVNTFSITSDGRKVVSGSDDTTLRVWDLKTGNCLQILEGHTWFVRSLALTPDGRKIVSGSGDNKLRVWDLESGKCLHILEGHTNWVDAVAITPDGLWAISGSREGDHHKGKDPLRLWDLESGRCIQTFEGQAPITITPDGRRLVSGSVSIIGSKDNSLRLWEFATGKCLRTLEGHTDRVYALVITPDGRRLVSAGEDTALNIWELTNDPWPMPEWVINRPLTVQVIQTAAQGIQKNLLEAELAFKNGHLNQAVTVLSQALQTPGFERDSSLLHLWHILGQKVGRVTGLRAAHRAFTLSGHTDWVNILAITPDGRKVVSGGEDKTIRIWELESGQDLHTTEAHEGGGVRVLAVTPDGRKAVSGGLYRTLYVWDIESGKCLHTLKGHTWQLEDLAITPDGRTAISCSQDKTLRVWDLESGECLHTLIDHYDYVHNAAITQDGHIAISGGSDKMLRIWSLESGACLRTFRGHTDRITKLAITPNERWFVSGGWDHTLRLWDLKSGKCLHTMEGQINGLNTIAITRDGLHVLAGCGDKTLKVWDLATGNCLYTLEGHTGPVSVLEVTPDGRKAISGSFDNTLRIWDLDSGSCLQTLTGHTGPVCALAITPDWRQVVSGSRDRTLITWTLDWDYDFPEPADWDDGAQPYIEDFLTLHTPYAGQLSQDRKPTDKEITLALTRSGIPTWTEDDFQLLMRTLGNRGYGWLRPEGVRRKLHEMAVERSR